MPATIINLSCIHTLHPHSTVIYEFARLRQRYTPIISWDFVGNKLHQSSLWLEYMWGRSDFSFINDYKLGKMKTAAFLGKIKEIIFPPGAYVDGAQMPTDKDLIAAWNALVDFTDQDKRKLEQIMQTASEENPVYLISNTNPLHAQKIFELFQKSCPEQKLKSIRETETLEPAQKPITVGSYLYFCPSYHYGQEKTDSLLETLIQTEKLDEATTRIISQWTPDRQAAIRLGMQEENVMEPGRYFTNPPQARRYCMIS